MNHIRISPGIIPPDKHLSQYLNQIQTHIHELIQVRFAIKEEDGKNNELLQAVQGLIISVTDIHAFKKRLPHYKNRPESPACLYRIPRIPKKFTEKYNASVKFRYIQ